MTRMSTPSYARYWMALTLAFVLAFAMASAALAIPDEFGGAAFTAPYAPYTAGPVVSEEPYAPYTAGPVVKELGEPYAPYVAGPVVPKETPYAPYTDPDEPTPPRQIGHYLLW